MATLRNLTLVVLLSGCSAFGVNVCPAHGNATPAVSEAQLRAAWAKSFGALPSPACDAHWTWSVMSDQDYLQTCGTGSNACTIYPAGCPLSATTAQFAQSRELNTHEFAHWALECSTGNGDPNHLRTDVWSTFDGSFGP